MGGESGRFGALHWVPGMEWITEGPRVFLGLIGLGIVNCPVEPFLHFASSLEKKFNFHVSSAHA